MIDDLLSTSQVKQRGLFNASVIERLLQEHRSARRDWSMQIWQLLTLELWMQTFLDGGAQKFESESMRVVQAATA